MVHLLPSQTLFICDAHVMPDPTAEELAEMTILCAEEVRGFGMVPKVALLSHSSFGASRSASSEKVRKALQILHRKAPELEVDGEMHADAALSEKIRNRVYPNSKLKGAANLLVMPNADAANITVNLLKVLGSGVTVGPILVGMSKSAHVVTQSATVRSLVNMSALAIGHAIRQQKDCS
jgi:malate dehydrogenase (oxaloacetate-decarboxylating)(NADP+)